jgi:metal-responsive CopG/Arc/MetJ family transcriptional regulator
MGKTVSVTVEFPQPLLETIRSIAKRKTLGVSGLIRSLVLDQLRSNGWLSPQERERLDRALDPLAIPVGRRAP